MTVQIPEMLILNGEATGMTSYPPLRRRHSRIYEKSFCEAEDGRDWIFGSSACWRGYQGSWEIVGDRLYLAELHGRLALRDEEPIFASWVSGVLRVPRGERIDDGQSGFTLAFERDLYIRVECGVVTATVDLDNRNSRNKRPRSSWKDLFRRRRNPYLGGVDL